MADADWFARFSTKRTFQEGTNVFKFPEEDGRLQLICYWQQAYHFEVESEANTTVYFIQNVHSMADLGRPLKFDGEKRTFKVVEIANK